MPDRVIEYPTEAQVTAWEAKAHAVRQITNSDHGRGSVGDDPSEAKQEAMGELTTLLAYDIGLVLATEAVTHWLIVDRPISDVAWWHRLTPGTRVRHRRDGREGTVRAADPDGMAESLDPAFLQRWVSWHGEPGEPVLVRTVDLSLVV